MRCMGTVRSWLLSGSLARELVDAPLLELLRCPVCRAGLSEADGALTCTGCGRSFAVEDGIPPMLHQDLPGATEKLGETAGWVEKARAEGWYEPDDAVDAVLPFVNRELGWEDLTWLGNAHSIEVLLDRYIGDRRGLRVLEVGAAKAWASRFWLERDCEFVATDILVDPMIGLGRGSFYGDFGRVTGRRRAPAVPRRRVRRRLLRRHAPPRARPAADGEGDGAGRTSGRGRRRAERGDARSERSPDNPNQEGEKALGINEHVHSVWAYAYAFTRAGLIIRRLERPDGWPPSPYGGKLSKIPKVGMTVGTLAHLSAAHYAGVSIYARKR